jgi:hypothetical protein
MTANQSNNNNGNLDTYEGILQQGLKFQRSQLKNPTAVYTMEFTKKDNKNHNNNEMMWINIKADFKHKSAVLNLSDNFFTRDEEGYKNCIDKAIEVIRVWGIEKFRIGNSHGHLTNTYLTKMYDAKPETNIEFMNRIKPKQLDTNQIQSIIQLGKEIRTKIEENEGKDYVYTLNTDDKLGISIDIRPNFKDKSAMLVVNDKFDFSNDLHLELVSYAIQFVKLWDLEEFGVGQVV